MSVPLCVRVSGFLCLHESEISFPCSEWLLIPPFSLWIKFCAHFLKPGFPGASRPGFTRAEAALSDLRAVGLCVRRGGESRPGLLQAARFCVVLVLLAAGTCTWRVWLAWPPDSAARTCSPRECRAGPSQPAPRPRSPPRAGCWCSGPSWPPGSTTLLLLTLSPSGPDERSRHDAEHRAPRVRPTR